MVLGSGKISVSDIIFCLYVENTSLNKRNTKKFGEDCSDYYSIEFKGRGSFKNE